MSMSRKTSQTFFNWFKKKEIQSVTSNIVEPRKVNLQFTMLARNQNTIDFIKSHAVEKVLNPPFKSCLHEDTVYNFIDSMVEQRKHCNNIIKIIQQITFND